ncbi:MAG TPA: nitronate monooxygenase [Acidimicrobiales bacterium]|jgi:NAD(P)H-dependent flavin oxidoreductase YrpB (nitropropane dioxygenase family)
MLRTSFTELVGCDVPIQLAPMGGAGTPELAAAVVEAGGMAMLATALVPLPAVERMLTAVAARARGPVGVNVLMPFYDAAFVEALAPRARLVDFYHGEPDASAVARVHEGGALAGWQVGEVDVAKAAVDAGCDLVVVRGTEGGGRMWGDRSLWPLLDEVLDAVDVPVVAAGGIGTGRGVAAALAAGAAAVRMGTRFIATEESGAHDVWKQAIIGASAGDTVLTDAFSVLWPNGPEPHRVLRSAVAAAERTDADVVAELPTSGGAMPLPRFAAVPPSRHVTGQVEAMALYAGESVYAVTGVERAGDVVRAIAADAEARLRTAAALL